MQEKEDLLDHINKVKVLAKKLVCFEVPMRDEDVVITLLAILQSSFNNLMTDLETMPIKELTMEFVMARLMHEMTKRKEKECQGEDIAMVLRQDKGNNLSTCKNIKTCYYCGKLGYIACFSFKTKYNNKEKVDAKNTKDDDCDYEFLIQDKVYSKAIYKWNMDSRASKHMTSHWEAFHTYEIIFKRNVYFGDNRIVEAIGMDSIVVEVVVKGITIGFKSWRCSICPSCK